MSRDPDLSICGLSIWIERREFPEALVDWDGNWLVLKATMRAEGSSVSAEGAFLTSTDFHRFRNELARMSHDLAGAAELSGYEENLKVTLTAGKLGHIGGEIEITPDHLTQFHRFDIGFDQTQLAAIISSCDAILERFPVVGQQKA